MTISGRLLNVLVVSVLLLASAAGASFAQPDPLASWNEGPAKAAITDFVAKVTDESGTHFVEPDDRIAVFDNDGTLWSEQPVYFQFAFALDRIRAMAPDHPEWKDVEPFKSVLAGDMKGLASSGEKGLLEVLAATHAGMTTEEFSTIVADWPVPATRVSIGHTTDSSINLSLNCSPTSVPMDSRPSLSRAAVSSSCASSPRKLMGSHPNRLSALPAR
jgi:hypothetical protein